MNIYKIERDDEACHGEYNSAVVYAQSAEVAKTIHPNGLGGSEDEWGSWVSPERVEATYLGVAADDTVEAGVIVASYRGD